LNTITFSSSLEEIQVVTEKQIREEQDSPWEVILFNDEVHSCEEVVFQIRKATGLGLQAASQVMMKAHSEGLAVCYSNSLEKCERVAAILCEIRLIVEVLRVTG
jgi:ATP-dependent Clp protease adaptor protein ClpS